MKEIIINLDNISDNEITDRKIINNYIFMYDNIILLKKHHNSYYFIHDDDLNRAYSANLFAIKKIYEKDYPFLGDNCLIEKKFYLVKERIDIYNGEWIEIKNIKDILNAERYKNPRVQDITDEIIEMIYYLTN